MDRTRIMSMVIESRGSDYRISRFVLRKPLSKHKKLQAHSILEPENKGCRIWIVGKRTIITPENCR